jgi:hypothetical protein
VKKDYVLGGVAFWQHMHQLRKWSESTVPWKNVWYGAAMVLLHTHDVMVKRSGQLQPIGNCAEPVPDWILPCPAPGT